VRILLHLCWLSEAGKDFLQSADVVLGYLVCRCGSRLWEGGWGGEMLRGLRVLVWFGRLVGLLVGCGRGAVGICVMWGFVCGGGVLASGTICIRSVSC
jgi:hypothetical protein